MGDETVHRKVSSTARLHRLCVHEMQGNINFFTNQDGFKRQGCGGGGWGLDNDSILVSHPSDDWKSLLLKF